MLAILLAAALAAAPAADVIYTADGDRLEGTVVEEGAAGVAVQLGDGTLRRFGPGQVVRIEYADGAVSRPAARWPGGAAPRSDLPPPPREPPPVFEPPPREPPPRLYLGVGLVASQSAGDAEPGVAMQEIVGTTYGVSFELGYRLSAPLALAATLDLGWGANGDGYQAICDSLGFGCGGTRSTRAGLLARYAWNPAGAVSPWLAIGTGWEWLDASLGDGVESESYQGWERARLTAGLDLRSLPVGVGLYASVAWTSFSRYQGTAGARDIPDPAVHTTASAGLRFTMPR
jgi:opacity protein-like surface antigen